MHDNYTFALSGFLQVAKRYSGGVGTWRNCLTNSNPSPRLAPVINTDLGGNMASTQWSLITYTNWLLSSLTIRNHKHQMNIIPFFLKMF